MSSEEKVPSEIEKTEALFRFLQGQLPDGCTIPEGSQPRLTPEQAWIVIWWLGNQYWQVPDYIERCDVCGDLFDTNSDGDCLDFGEAPYHFCGICEYGNEYADKQRSKQPSDTPTAREEAE